eukprot:TRINITY_DN13630_c0_g1_i1.p1 TRINITY_DN13630_c0_g1~~TRINITY_DN13630_c0_g1_i1.p1  ORF type:complete len:160 (+),score=24.04 TRINITY_DN13630_c0_g1_i1:64-543(+)
MCIRDRVSTQSTWGVRVKMRALYGRSYGEPPPRGKEGSSGWSLSDYFSAASSETMNRLPSHQSYNESTSGEWKRLEEKYNPTGGKYSKIEDDYWRYRIREYHRAEFDQWKERKPYDYPPFAERFEPEKTSIPRPDPQVCLLYTSPSPRDRQKSRMPSSA